MVVGSSQSSEANAAPPNSADRIDILIRRFRRGGIEYIMLLRDYKVLFMSGLVMFGLGILLPSIPISSVAPNLCARTMLCTHGSTPWGVLTSLFLYDGWMNIPAYFFVLLTYVSFSDHVDPVERKKRAHFALAASLFAAVLANIFWVAILPKTFSWGSSGVIYVLWGVLLAFTFFDGMPKQPRSLNPRSWYKDKKEQSSAMNNLGVFSVTALLIFSEPEAFLSAGPNVNVFAHSVSFLVGYFATLIYTWRLKYRRAVSEG